MLDYAFELKALEYAVDLLRGNKDKEHTQERDYILSVLKEREEEIRMAKEEEIGTA